MSFIQDFENIIGLVSAIDTGKTDRLYDGLAQMIEANASKGLAEAKAELGDDFYRYVAQPRAVLRAQREEARVKHEIAMNAEILQQEKLRTLALTRELKLDTDD